MRLLYGARGDAPPTAGAPALDIAHLHVTYPRTSSLVVRDLSLQIAPGELVALVGPNGAGKSSLLKAVAGLLAPQSGQIRVFGQMGATCRDRIAYLPQRGEIDWRFPISVERLVLTGRYVHLGWLQRPQAQDSIRAAQALAALGIDDLAARQIGALSGGQQQRALLARALVQDGDLLLLDEPFNGVDSTTTEVLLDVLAEQRKEGVAVVMATHDLSIAHLACDTGCLLNHHQVAFGPIAEALTPQLLGETYGRGAVVLAGDSTIVTTN
jgi:ABC-type Mn2+/Zn2+ transport system ATPase subunit